MKLSELKPRQTGIITQIKLVGELNRRLSDMGFTAGAEITALRTAPLGDPTEYLILGYRLCLRKCEAEKIYIKLN